jgi:16S rRNA (uracil1498-N3)-methyltransferase
MMQESHLHRFFIRAECISGGKVYIDGPDARQICSVLRLRCGDKIAALDGTGCILTVRITESTSSGVHGDVLEVCSLDTEPKVRLTLAQALPKSDKLEFVIQKGTEIGVAKFLVVTSARTVPQNLGDRMERKLTRWQTIAKEAAEQSCRAVVPEVYGIVHLEEIIETIGNYDLAICLWENEAEKNLKEILSHNRSAKNVLLLIGPEGGFEEKEVRAMEAKGALTASLGKRILRCETAAISSAAIVLYEMETQ